MTGSNAEMPRMEASWSKLAELVNQVQAAGNTHEHYAERFGWMNQLINESSAAR